MTDPLHQLLAPEPLPPDEGEYLARRLTVTLRLAAAAIAAGALITSLGDSGDTPLVLAARLPVALALVLARRRQIGLAALVLIPSMLALATGLVWRGDGLQDLGLLIYPVVVVIASLLLDRRRFALVLGLAVACLGWVAWGQARGQVRALP